MIKSGGKRRFVIQASTATTCPCSGTRTVTSFWSNSRTKRFGRWTGNDSALNWRNALDFNWFELKGGVLNIGNAGQSRPDPDEGHMRKSFPKNRAVYPLKTREGFSLLRLHLSFLLSGHRKGARPDKGVWPRSEVARRGNPPGIPRRGKKTEKDRENHPYLENPRERGS